MNNYVYISSYIIIYNLYLSLSLFFFFSPLQSRVFFEISVICWMVTHRS